MAYTTNKKRLIKKLHDSSGKFVAVITGGGLSAMADILSVPGASKTVLEVTVPYSKSSLFAYIKENYESHVSKKEAILLANIAYKRSKTYEQGNNVETIGISCTAAIATIPVRKGTDRAFVACTNGESVSCASIYFSNEFRSRFKQDEIISGVILNFLSGAFNLDISLNLDLHKNEGTIEYS